KPDPDEDGVTAARGVHEVFEADLEKRGIYGNVSVSDTREKLRNAAVASLEVLLHAWPTTPVLDGYGDMTAGDMKDAPDVNGRRSSPEAGASEGAFPGHEIDQPTRAWLQMAEELVAVELVTSVRQYLVHLRNLAAFLTIGPLLLL